MTHLRKNAFAKDILREIKNTYDRFIGIFVIIALGVSFFAGIGSTGTRMKIVQNEYFVAQNLMDIRIVSTFGLNQNDVFSIAEIEGVKAVYPSYSIDALVRNNDNSLLLKVHSIDIANEPSKRVNKPSVLSGRLPEKADEAVVEEALLRKLGMSVGDAIMLESGKKADIRNNLRTQRYKIVGTVKSPYYISTERGTGSIGSGNVDCFIMIPLENFYQDVYSEVFVTVEGADELMCFGDAYMDAVGVVVDRLEELEPVRAKERSAEMTQKAYDDINKQQSLLINKQLEASALFDETEAALLSFKTQIDNASNELAAGRNKANKSLRELRNTIEKLNAGLIETDAGLNTVNDMKNDLRKSLSDLDEAAAMYMGTASGEPQSITAMREQVYVSLASLDMAESELEQQRDMLKQSIAEANMGKKELESYLRSITQSEKQITENRLSYAKELAEFEEAKRRSGIEIEEAEQELLKARERHNDISEPEWYIMDRESNAGFLSYREDADKIQALGRIFPLFFFLVAALICLTTMTRLVEERRTEIGTLKALGYGNFKIQSKYIIYAVLPTLLGGIAGGYIGMTAFPNVIIGAYKSLYTIPDSGILIDYPLWIIGVLLGVFSTTTAAISTCGSEMKENPATLLRPKTPKFGKKTIFESFTAIWRRLSFIKKVTVRNIVRYKKRFFMTVAGIGGCTALLLAGFGIKNSISGLIDKQFNKILAYDMKVAFQDGAKKKDVDNIYDILSASSIINGCAQSHEKIMDAQQSGGRPEKVTLIVPEETEELDRYIGLRERVGQKPLSVREDGVIINEKLATLLKLSAGDEIALNDGDKIVKAKIAGICENYFNNFVFMHKETYKALFGEEAEYNAVYALLDKGALPAESASLANAMLDKKKVSAVTFMETQQRQLDSVIESLNTVVLVIVVCAGALAFVVLYNLTNININERIRELATIEVLGFRDREVEAYVYRENVILTVVGILFGFLLGYLLHLYIIRSVESRLMMFSREIWLSSYIYAVLITTVFSLSVNKLTSSKLKKINMVEALKSVE